MAFLKLYIDWDRNGADAACKRGFELEPGNANVAGDLGRMDEALALDQRSTVLDPLLPAIYTHNFEE